MPENNNIEFIELENEGNKKTIHLSEVKEIVEIYDPDGGFLYMDVLTKSGYTYNSKIKELC